LSFKLFSMAAAGHGRGHDHEATPSRWGRCHPHPSQCRTSRFPASGSSRESFARRGVWMSDPDWRQRVAFQDLVHARPPEHALAISPRQPPLPNPPDLMGVPAQSSTVATNAIVGVVAPHHCGQMSMLVANGPVPVFPTPVVHRGHGTSKPALGRSLPNHVPALP